MSSRLRRRLGNSALGTLKRAWDRRFKKPTITQPWLPPLKSDLEKTLLICVEASFDQRARNAHYLTPLAFAQGWTKAAGGAKFVHAKDLFKELEGHDRPAIFISQSSFRHFTHAQARTLRGKDVFVWVHVHPRSFCRFEILNPLVPQNESDMYLDAYPKVVLAEPRFVWNAIGKSGMEWFRGWLDDGFRWETIFPGANTDLYYYEPSDKFRHIKVGYVGGYWEEKAQAFTSYLRPLEDIFVPFGYDRWPYKHYGGGLSEADERRLYSSAGVIPLLTGPAGWRMAEITERYLKAPACKAFCIADENPAVRELFDEPELLQATSSEHFLYLIGEFLRGNIDTERWREATYRAVLRKHCVEHRAAQILRALQTC